MPGCGTGPALAELPPGAAACKMTYHFTATLQGVQGCNTSMRLYFVFLGRIQAHHLFMLLGEHGVHSQAWLHNQQCCCCRYKRYLCTCVSTRAQQDIRIIPLLNPVVTV
eukprot:GHUV01041067.1.p2 GENE.GHUV01041067.1~~GHUV01041067.1.p2  ORF type:complete len:109 (+),score=6.68 GHUV01041067.1:1209-1535(+)